MFYTSINISVVIGPIVGAVLFFNHRFILLLVSGIIFCIVGLAIRFLTEETLPDDMKAKMASGSNNWTQVIVTQVNSCGLIVKDKVCV